MNAVGMLGGYISRGVFTVFDPFHPFGGAVDIIVVQQPDGSLKSSPWYVKFGKFQGVLKTKEKVVSIAVNGVDAEFHMYLDHRGEAYFLRELNGEQVDSVYSPPSSSDETEEQSQSGRIEKPKSGDFDANQPSSAASIGEANAKDVAKTSSRRSGFLGFVFGSRSMKEEGSRSEGSSVGVGAERMGSLERAEIAADLLEVNWSTNLSTIVPKIDDISTFSLPVDEADKDLQGNNEQLDSPMFCDSINNPESPEEVISPKKPPLTTQEQFMEIPTLEAFNRCKEISEVSTVFNQFSLENTFFDEGAEGSVSKSAMAGSQNPDLVELEAGQSSHSNIERSDKMSAILSNAISEDKAGNENFSSFTYRETTEISTVGMNVSFEQATENLEFCYGRCEEVEPHGEVLSHNTELITEVTPQPDSRVLTVEENFCPTGIIGHGYRSTFFNTETVHENELTSVNSVTESPLPLNLHATFNSVETEMLELNQQDTVTKGLAQNDNLEPGSVEILENESQITDLSLSNISEYNEVGLGKPSKVLVSLNQEAGVSEIFDSVEAAGSQSMHTSSHLSNSSPVQCKENIVLDDSTNDHYPSSQFVSDTQEAAVDSISVKESIPQSESSEEDQLLFGDIDGLDPVGVQFNEPVSQESMQIENHSSLTLDGIEDEHGRVDINNASSLSPGKLADEYPASSFEDLIEESGTLSRPISIPKAYMDSGENGVWLPESLPIIRHIDSLEGSDAHHPLSHSLDSSSGNLKLGFLGQVVTTSSKPDADSEYILAHEHPRISDTEASEELGLESTRSPVGDPEIAIVQSGGTWRFWPFQIGKSRTPNSMPPALNGTKDSDASDCTGDIIKDKNVPQTKVTEKKVRSIVPTSEQLETLNLEEGRNIITFTFSTAVLGRQQVDARIYLWKWNTRVVVSDVDGTITRSDVLGQFMPLVGKDWSHTGVTHLFSAIKENGYQLLFLSARSISQAYLTRQFLFNLKQDGKSLPDGPVVISPDGLFPSLFREVIRRAPHEFKIACLEDIKAIFPQDCNPFYAGFGNRDTDEFSYLKVGIPKGKIFIINPKGEVAINRQVDTKSYTSLHALVNGMFPAMSSAEQEDFNSWNYWKMPLPEINV